MLSNSSTTRRAARILELSRRWEKFSDEQLKERALDLTWSIRSGVQMKSLLNEAYAIGVVAAKRTFGFWLHTVQVVGALEIFGGKVAEMQTGEGKTITAVLPALLRAMEGRGVHVITANEYLASRDAEQMGQVYQKLGLSAGCITQQMTDQQRIEQYQRDITYGTASEIGFDFLRDRLKNQSVARQVHTDRVQRGQYFALIDEADSILIDEARTPLVIGVNQVTNHSNEFLFRWCGIVSSTLSAGSDYYFDEQKQQANLTQAGSRKLTILPIPKEVAPFSFERVLQTIEKSLTAKLAYKCGRDYLITDGKVVIIDEGTGRQLDGRKWQNGIHQAIEAKEKLDLTSETASAARISVQSLFRQYENLAGMTGTASQVSAELRRVYKLKVAKIPTHRPGQRVGLPPRIFSSINHKYQAIADAAKNMIEQNRSVLIGTPSVEASEQLSQKLREFGIEHTVLNATFHQQEAEIVSLAGQVGRVTIATNMAGRGTDIPLHDTVKENGGLHIIATEFHSSKRIDRQLIGRAARQGEPGTYQFFISLEDEIFRSISPEKHGVLLRKAANVKSGELANSWLHIFERLQRKLETTQARHRKSLLLYEKERSEHLRHAGLDPYLDSVQ